MTTSPVTTRANMTHMTDLVPTAAAARAIGVSARTLARWAREGMVRATLTTAGGQRRWDVADLRAQLDRIPPTPEPEASQSVIDPHDERGPAVQRVTGLVGSGAAAEAVGATKSALTKWMREGLVTPAQRVGRRGDARWDLDKLRDQMAARGLQGRTPPAGDSHSDRHPRT